MFILVVKHLYMYGTGYIKMTCWKYCKQWMLCDFSVFVFIFYTNYWYTKIVQLLLQSCFCYCLDLYKHPIYQLCRMNKIVWNESTTNENNDTKNNPTNNSTYTVSSYQWWSLFLGSVCWWVLLTHLVHCLNWLVFVGNT